MIQESAEPADIEPEARQELRARLNLSHEHTVILALPPVTRAGGTFDAAWASMLVEKVRPDVRLVVPSGGRELQRVRGLVESCRHEFMVRFAGPSWTLPALLNLADVAAFAPVTDVSTTALVHAIAAARPVVATRVPCVCRVLPPDLTTHLCPPHDIHAIAAALLRLLEHPHPAPA